MSGQLPLPFEPRSARARADFLVADENRDAVGWVDRWPDWPAPLLIVSGPPASGKSHLGAVFLALTGGTSWRASLAEIDPTEVMDRCPALLLDSLEDALEHLGEQGLFHLYNAARDSGGHILALSEAAPSDLGIALADLKSRLQAAPAAVIRPPGDALLRQVLAKHFHDRQLSVDKALIDYLVPRIERTFEAAAAIVAELDAAALAHRRAITLPLARRMLERERDA
ncbi:MAG: HdaA/DnaA family protein [Rhodospirillales bacterium]